MKYFINILMSMTCMSLPLSSCAKEQVETDTVNFPQDFLSTKENALIGAENISRFFNKLEKKDGQIRVLHIGDSHVRGHVLPGYVRKALEKSFGSEAMGEDKIGYSESAIATETGQPGLVYSAIGINGAQVQSFLKAEMLQKIALQKPDLVILSFGTNEAYGDRYSPEHHTQNMDRLLTAIRERCGEEVEILLTTPPGCMKDDKNDVKHPNPNNGTVATAIVNYALDHQMAVWDMYTIFGGDQEACNNWMKAGMMRRDGVHFTNEGYKLQGRMLGKAIAEAFNKR